MLPGTSTSASVPDSAARERTRVLLLFSLSGRLHPRDTALGALVDRYDHGRFASHLMTSQDVLPLPVLDERMAPGRLRLPHGDHGLGLASLRILMITEAFQSWRGDALGIRGSLENSAPTVERLTSVISARSAALDAQLAERDDRRDRTVSGPVAAATLIALPPTLLPAFFGVNGTNVDEHRSIPGLRAYGTAYAPAWPPFVVLALIGWILLRRVRAGSGPLPPAPDDDFAPVPPPRPPFRSPRP
ncbi:hypothetical protein ABTZ58_27190 [Streptomyces sp. NPDC094143]|uniref:hypothetical protein n=1 Tax=Streptomyces sp. NPDC094143 TaxID=3155310 RepID=UPI003329851D